MKNKIKNLKKTLHSALCALHSRPKRAGFTLVELLIYMGIFSILLGVLAEVFVSIVSVQLSSESTSTLEQDGRFIAARLIHDINNAQTITTPANPGDQTATLQIIKDSINYSYSLNANNFLLSDAVGSDRLNGYDTTISNLTFKKLGNIGGDNTITINFTLTSQLQQKSGIHETRAIQTTVGIRK